MEVMMVWGVVVVGSQTIWTLKRVLVYFLLKK